MGYQHTNSKGVTYYLNTKEVLFNNKPRSIYYFSKDDRPTACDLPLEYEVAENAKNGFLTLKKNAPF